MMISVRFFALFSLAFSVGAQEAPPNDSCESAIEVTSFPFTDSGSLANATINNFNYTCTQAHAGNSIFTVFPEVSKGSWYVLPGVSMGTELRLSYSGIGSGVRGSLLELNDQLGSCPDHFLCPQIAIGSTTMDSSGSNEGLITMTTENDDSIYYFVVYTATGTAEPEFKVEITTRITTVAQDTASDSLSQEPPPNNLCESATEVTTFPFSDSGSLANATRESLNISCYGGWEGIDVWYVFPEVSEGTEYEISMFGIGGEVQGWVLKSNNELGTCPEEFLCPELITATSSIDPTGSTQSRLIVTAEKDAFYYLALYSTSNTTGPDFEVTVDTLAPIPESAPSNTSTDPTTTTTSNGCKQIGSVAVAVLVWMGLLLNAVV